MACDCMSALIREHAKVAVQHPHSENDLPSNCIRQAQKLQPHEFAGTVALCSSSANMTTMVGGQIDLASSFHNFGGVDRHRLQKTRLKFGELSF